MSQLNTVLKYGDVIEKGDRNTIFKEAAGFGDFAKTVRECANGLLNGDGGQIFFGIKDNGRTGTVRGFYVSRGNEDDYRLTVDRTIGSFLPFVAPVKYRLIFHPCQGAARFRASYYKVIELKISAGAVGELYEDGLEKCYLFSKNELLGPLMPQEIQELVLFKYQESIKQLKALQKFSTPFVNKKKKKSKGEV